MVDWGPAPQEESDSEDDLAELEARLYSQIYYESEEPQTTINHVAEYSVKQYGVMEEVAVEEDVGTNKAVINDVTSDDEEESRYQSAKASETESSRLQSNPFYKESEDSSGSEDDDGILVIPPAARRSPEVIQLEDTEEPILVSDGSGPEVLEESHELRERGGGKRKNSAKKIRQALRTEHYREEYGSDFDDNFLSDNDLDTGDVDDSGISLGNLLGSGTPRLGGKRKVSEVFSESLARTEGRVAECPESWTREMDLFYNHVDRELLDIDLDSVLAGLDPSPAQWAVDRVDLYGGGRERPRYFGGGRKCHNCNQPGHVARECPEKPKEARCCMCGVLGHRDSRCPGRCCLQCGQPSFSFTESCPACRRLADWQCGECGYRGHRDRDCPDLWRRYHLTTTGSSIVTPRGAGGWQEDLHRPVGECWCCNCGRRGHLAESCRRRACSKYPVTTARVVSYAEPVSQGDPFGDSPAIKKSRLEGLYRQAASCPASPAARTEVSFSSQPASPSGLTRQGGFPSALLEKAEEKLTSRRAKRKQGIKEKKRQLIGEKLESGMSRAEVLEDVIVLDHVKKNMKKAKKLKSLIRDCDQGLKARREMRAAEFQGKRGFCAAPKAKPTLQKNEVLFPRGSRKEKVVTRAEMIPTSIQAAWKFLKKEAQKVTKDSSEMGKRLKKDLKQEIFGLKHGMHAAPRLKKVERKRLADMVMNLRNHA